MNGVHDMGGMDGFGTVPVEANEPLFHARWESRTYALMRALGFTGAWSIDEFRYVTEGLPPHVYLSSSYYERWALTLELLVLKYGLASKEELESLTANDRAVEVKRVLKPDSVKSLIPRPNYERDPQAPAVFSVGDLVRTKNIHPVGATRLPRYTRGKVGRVERIQGCHAFPDTVVSRDEEDPQWLYTVTFDGRELWGPDADPTSKISIEAFEPYLEPEGTHGGAR